MGHVILSNPRVHVEGDRIQFNYKQNTGFIYNGFVQSGQVVFEGDVVEKAGETRYIASNAEFTACDTCPAGWAFSGRRIDAEVGGYARIRRPVFKIAGVPVLILPSLIVPLKTDRQSGFLVPTQEFTQRGGFGLGESYFWAIDRSKDLTLEAKRIERRGPKVIAEYRYVASENGQGTLRTTWGRDRALVREYGLKNDFDRWLIKYDHHLELPGGFTHRANLALPSDLRYARDFPYELPGHGNPALENRVSVSQSGDAQFWSGEVDLYTNLLKSYPLGTNEDAVHRAPELHYVLKERRLFERGPFAALDVTYVNFARPKSNYDDLDNGRATVGSGQNEVYHDGHFDPVTDLFRTGERLDVRPTLTYPFQLWRKFDVIPIVSYRETQYKFNRPTEARGFGATAARRFLQTDLRVKTEMSRVFESPSGNRWKHAVEPEVGYSRVPLMRRPTDHPFFGEFRGIQYSRQYQQVSDNDITDPNTRVQFDYEDRTFDRNIVDFGVTNRLTRKLLTKDEPVYNTAALFSVWQSYDLNERTTGHPWSSLNALLDLRFENVETYTVLEYNGYAKVTNTSSRLKLMATKHDFLQLSYTRNTQFTSNYRITPDTETRNVGVGGGFVTGYVEAVGMLNYSTYTNQLQSWQYEVLVRPPGHCWSLRVMHRQMLGGDAQIFIKPAFDFGGAGGDADVAKR